MKAYNIDNRAEFNTDTNMALDNLLAMTAKADDPFAIAAVLCDEKFNENRSEFIGVLAAALVRLRPVMSLRSYATLIEKLPAPAKTENDPPTQN